MRLHPNLSRSFCFILTLWIGVVCAEASSVQGRISDTDGAPVAGAQIIVRQPESNFSKTVVTRSDGNYVLDTLSPGVYVITIRKTGFADLVQEKVVGSGEEPLQLNFRLDRKSVV